MGPGIVLPNMVPEPSAMPFMRSAFADLLEPLDRRAVARAVGAHGGDHGVGAGDNAWTCERHLKALLFAQFAGLKSLREIVEALGGQSASFYHLNLRAPCRSTLADANRARPWAVFRDIAAALLPVAAGALRRDGAALIRLLDATPIALRDARFAWAEASARIRGLKLICFMTRGRAGRCGSRSARPSAMTWWPAAPCRWKPAPLTSSTRAIPITAGGPRSRRPAPSSLPARRRTPAAARSRSAPPRATASSSTAASRSATARRAAGQRRTRCGMSGCAKSSW